MASADWISIHIEEYTRLKADAADAAGLRAIVGDASYYVRAAARIGFVNVDQEDAVWFALERLTGQPRELLKAIIDIAPRGYRGR